MTNSSLMFLTHPSKITRRQSSMKKQKKGTKKGVSHENLRKATGGALSAPSPTYPTRRLPGSSTTSTTSR